MLHMCKAKIKGVFGKQFQKLCRMLINFFIIRYALPIHAVSISLKIGI